MKLKEKKIFNGIVSLLISQILIKIIGLAYKLYLTNKDGFGDAGNAIYSSGFQIYALLLTLSSIGVPNAISRLVAQRRAIGDNKGAHKIFKIAFFTFAFFGLLGTILLFLCANYISNNLLEIPEAKYSLITLSPSIFLVSITSVIRGYFNGMQNLTVTAKSQTIEQIFKTVFTIIFVEIVAKISKNNTILMAGVANLATTFATLFSFLYIYMYYKLKRKQISQDIFQSVDYIPTRIRKTLKNILKESIPISLSSLMSSFNKNIDLFTVIKILKKQMSEEQATLQYGILSGKIDTLCVLPLSLNIPFVTGMIPEITKSMAEKNENELKNKIETYLKISMMMALPITIEFIIFSSQILNILFPNASNGSMLLQINSISIFFMMMNQTINGILQSIGKGNIPVVSYIFGIIIKFLLNIILISNKRIGIYGAAIGNIMCNVIVYVIGYITLKKNVNINLKSIFEKIICGTFLLIGVSLFVYYFMNRLYFEKISAIIAIIIGMGSYIVFIILSRILKEKEN